MDNSYNFKNKYALITGGTHGIGLAITLLLAKNGCNVAFSGRDKDKHKNTINLLKKYNIDYISLIGDVLKDREREDCFNQIINKWGKIDILINNVGGGGRWGKENIEDTDPIVWHEVYKKNAEAAIFYTRKCTPLMRKNSWGRVICIASIYGKEAGGRPWFNIAKSAQITLMKNLSKHKYLVRNGITFNTVSPGGIFIEGTGFEKEKLENLDKFNNFVDDNFPIGRMGTPEEVAELVVFLCSNKASFINGSQIMIDGGQSVSF
jgi:3-oxoacyl-[acyl-carrier protein] reductase